jgi:rSAM/selenodomain-associated transferase 1
MPKMRRLLLFARRPRLGKVKTRLCPPLEPDQALALYRAFLTDQLSLLRRCAADYHVEVWWDGRADETLAGFDLAGIEQCEQVDGDLGARLAHAFAAADEPAVAIGADSPTLGRDAIDAAFAALSELRPVVLMPAIDGGYVLIGLRSKRPEVFSGIPWGGPHVAAATLEQAKKQGLRVQLLPHGYDVDDESGLRRLEADLSHPEIAARAPATLRALRLLF